MKDFTRNESAWADFLISKAALIIASIILFSALFHLVSTFKELEVQEQLDSLTSGFKKFVDQTGAENLQKGSYIESQGESEEINYCFEEIENFRALSVEGDMNLRISGEYVCLEASYDKRNFISVKPFAFRVLPFNESELHEKLLARFGAESGKESPITANYSEIKAFLQTLGTDEAVLNPYESISIKKKLIYVTDGEEVSTFGCILIFQ